MRKGHRFTRLASFVITFSLACCAESPTESETQSKIEPSLKLIVINSLKQVTEVESDGTRTWQLPAEVDQRVVSVSPGPRGQLLLVEEMDGEGQDGEIGVVSGERPKEYKQIGEDGLVAAWSNDGRQIAIVHQTWVPLTEETGLVSHTLEILDADFNTLWTQTIDSPGDDDVFSGVDVCLSWSADDRLLSFSLRSIFAESYLIVDVHTRKVFQKNGYSSVFFIGSRVLTGRHYTGNQYQEQLSEIQTAQVELQADSVDIVSPTTIVAISGTQLCGFAPTNEILVSASSNPARLVMWTGDVWLTFPYASSGPCRILDEQGQLLAEMPEIFGSSDAFCLARSEAE